jgi:hypothetical protein
MDPKSAVRLAVTADIAPGGLVLMIGLGGRLGVLCAGAIIDAGLRSVAIASIDEAIVRMPELRPKIVMASGTVTRTERVKLLFAARASEAELAILPVIVEMVDITHAIARTLAQHQTRRASGG